MVGAADGCNWMLACITLSTGTVGLNWRTWAEKVKTLVGETAVGSVTLKTRGALDRWTLRIPVVSSWDAAPGSQLISMVTAGRSSRPETNCRTKPGLSWVVTSRRSPWSWGIGTVRSSAIVVNAGRVAAGIWTSAP